MLGGVLALFSRRGAGHGICRALGDFGFAVVAVWISICASHFVFRRRHLQSGQPLSALQYRAPVRWCRCSVLSSAWWPVSACGLTQASALPFIADPVCRPVLWCLLPDPKYDIAGA
jgi:hypothetical protein